MKFSTRYKREHAAPRITITEQSLTKQSFAKEADINTIVNRVLKGSAMPQGERQPRYGDFTGLDYVGMQNQIALVNQSFAELPSDVRRRFDNDPSELLAFLGDPENRDEAIELGLLPTLDQNIPSESPGKGASEAPAPSPTPPPEPAPAKTA